MIHYIKGVITETMPGMVIIENGGIGYQVYVPDSSSAYLSKENEVVTLFTSMIVREDDISLYGFTDNESLIMFNMLMTVSGIGAKGAMAILSSMNVRELKRSIAFEDVNAITKAQGIGKKTAQRLVLELKDKVGLPDEVPAGVTEVKLAKGSAKEEAVMGLMALGYSKTEAMSALVGITDESLSAGDYIKLALRSRR